MAPGCLRYLAKGAGRIQDLGKAGQQAGTLALADDKVPFSEGGGGGGMRSAKESENRRVQAAVSRGASVNSLIRASAASRSR